jgi:hypothetical protein
MRTPPIPWKQFQEAIFDVVVEQCELDEDFVQWGDQDIPEGGEVFIALKRVGPIEQLGRDVLDVRQDDTADAATERREITFSVTGQRLWTLNIQAYVGSSSGVGAGVNVALTAEDYLSLLMAAMDVPSVHDALLAAGLAVSEMGKILNLDEIAGAGWRSRASLDIVFGCASNLTDVQSTTYIARADVAGTLSDTNPNPPGTRTDTLVVE